MGTWMARVLAAGALLAACESTVGGGTDFVDSGTGPGADAGAGAGPDAGADAGRDAGTGSGADAGTAPDPCEPIAGASYGTLTIVGSPTDRPPAEHGDLNLKLRGWAPTGGTLGLVEVDGPTDTLAPKLNTLFPDDRVPAFVANYRVHHWDWGCDCRGGPITDWEVTLAGFGVLPGEALELPDSGYDIGEGYEALVLFADDDSITLKYTREDNVVAGYTVHVVGVCVEPSLRALYDARHAAGRGALPALRANQPFARARGAEVLVAIRDTGAFMDPRVRKDWW